ncbi:hypothetical protein Vadar_033030 [Vaccinium darrowii]|uniref:Uncharacterized protein n=1 Tax=Vaccinium darrowii TaxID=229202 RepID=A0ACB7ZPJ7_9ERIC|nr:hypothetical protein Vadar_033030 [Vaccinium darrowii]
MKTDFGCNPKMEHFSCVVDLLARAGWLEDVVGFITKMPIEPDKSIWGVVLSASKAQQDIHFAMLASEHLVHLEPNYAGHYVTLVNMYATAGRWDEAVQDTTAMVQQAIQYIEETSDIESKIQLIWTLNSVAAGKVYVEIREQVKLAKIKEDQWQIKIELCGFGRLGDLGRFPPPPSTTIPTTAADHTASNSGKKGTTLKVIYMMEVQDLRQWPIDDTVLVLQQGHRSRAGRGPRESATITIRYCEREFRALAPPSAPIVELVRHARFFGLLNMQYMQLDLALLTALVERWRPETPTFHFTSVEATVTLQDVEIITGLSVDGRPVTGSTDLNWEQMVWDLLGLELKDTEGRRGNKVTLQWLRRHFNGQVQETDTQVQIEQKARGYIMQLIGGMLVPDESSGRVHLCCLELLRDLRAVGQYSWGSAGLGTLYRGLCQILKMQEASLSCFKWDDKFHSPNLATHVVGHYRHSLDMQKPDEVISQPYKDGLIELLPPFCSAGRNIWRAKVPFINFNIVEMHQPESHATVWISTVATRTLSCSRPFARSEPDIVGAYPDEDEYVTWYKRITVTFVSQMSASLDKAMNLFRSLITTDESKRVHAVGRQGLMCIVAQEKFLRKEPPVHGVWSPPAVVEEDEGVED